MSGARDTGRGDVLKSLAHVRIQSRSERARRLALRVALLCIECTRCHVDGARDAIYEHRQTSNFLVRQLSAAAVHLTQLVFGDASNPRSKAYGPLARGLSQLLIMPWFGSKS